MTKSIVEKQAKKQHMQKPNAPSVPFCIFNVVIYFLDSRLKNNKLQKKYKVTNERKTEYPKMNEIRIKRERFLKKNVQIE